MSSKAAKSEEKLPAAKVARTAAASYKLVQGLSRTSCASKVSFLIPNDISANIMSALRSSKTELFRWSPPERHNSS